MHYGEAVGGVRLSTRRPVEIRAAADGTFTGYGSVWGVLDSYGDVVAKGAFSQTLREYGAEGRMPALLWQHDMADPCGTWIEMREDDHGLYVRGRFADTARGRDARTLLMEGAISGLSIGFRTRKSKVDDETGIRTLLDVKLYEISIVTFPANEAARVESVRQSEMRELLASIQAQSARMRAEIAASRTARAR